MNLWQRFEMKNQPEIDNHCISFHYDKGLDPAIRTRFISFARWLRKKYIFPVHLDVYVLNCEQIRLQNGKMAYGSFRWFPKRTPFIRIPAAVEPDISADYDLDEIQESMLSSLVHELTHYYQWILHLEQSDAVSERQANYFRFRIVDQYYIDDGSA